MCLWIWRISSHPFVNCSRGWSGTCTSCSVDLASLTPHTWATFASTSPGHREQSLQNPGSFCVRSTPNGRLSELIWRPTIFCLFEMHMNDYECILIWVPPSHRCNCFCCNNFVQAFVARYLSIANSGVVMTEAWRMRWNVVALSLRQSGTVQVASWLCSCICTMMIMTVIFVDLWLEASSQEILHISRSFLGHIWSERLWFWNVWSWNACCSWSNVQLTFWLFGPLQGIASVFICLSLGWQRRGLVQHQHFCQRILWPVQVPPNSRLATRRLKVLRAWWTLVMKNMLISSC